MSRRDAAVVAVLLALVVAMVVVATTSTPTSAEPPSTWPLTLTQLQAGQSTRVVADEPLTPDQLSQLQPYLAVITELDVGGPAIDSAWSLVGQCPRLETLRWRSPVNDEQIATLRSLEKLRVLDLPQGTFSDRGLRSLARHPALQLLRLRSLGVTDSGIEVLAELPALRFVHLIEVPVTDAGLAVFRRMPQLESLYLDGDRATDDGLSALIGDRPDLHFHRDQTHLRGDPRSADGHHSK